EGPGPAAFDRMQQGQRDDCAGIQFGLRVFRDLQHLLVHRVEQCDNKILGSHTPGSSRLKSVQPQLELSRDYLSTRTLAITYQTNTIGYYLGCLAHASYLLADEQTGTAVVVDPQRDIDQYVDDAQQQGLQIRYVFLTHFHADFLAG